MQDPALEHQIADVSAEDSWLKFESLQEANYQMECLLLGRKADKETASQREVTSSAALASDETVM